MDRRCLTLLLCLSGALAPAQQSTVPTASQGEAAAQPLPPIRELLLDVEQNEKTAEAARKDYTYHVHLERKDLDSKGEAKKIGITDAESLTIDGVRVDRIVARNGMPLSAGEAKKESDRIDKAVAKAKEEREKREREGKDTDANGDVVISAARILELGSFSNPRRVELDGRPTIVVDYAGDPDAKTRNRFESVVRDLVGIAWIDEHDRVLVRAQGHFLNDFKIGGGLLVDIKRGSSFEVRYAKVNNEVWLPAEIDGQGKIRFLFFTGFNGQIHMATSDYKKFRATATIIPSDRIIGPDGQPVLVHPATEKPVPAQRPSAEPKPTEPAIPQD